MLIGSLWQAGPYEYRRLSIHHGRCCCCCKKKEDRPSVRHPSVEGRRTDAFDKGSNDGHQQLARPKSKGTWFVSIKLHYNNADTKPCGVSSLVSGGLGHNNTQFYICHISKLL